MNGPGPTVSVVIPYHNEGEMLRRSVESVWAQNWDAAEHGGGVEVVVSDDGSTVPPPPDLFAAGAGRWPVRAVRSDVSRYAGAARNRGAAAAAGEFLTFLDADDIYLPDRLDPHVRLLREHPGAALCGSPHRVRHPDGRAEDGPTIVSRHLPESAGAAGLLPAPAAADAVLGIPFHTGAVTVRRALFADVGGFGENFRWGEEWDLMVRLAARGPTAYWPEAGCAYLCREGSVCSTENPLKYVSAATMAADWLRDRDDLPAEHRRFLRGLARQRHLLAAQVYWESDGRGDRALRHAMGSFRFGPSVWGCRSAVRYGLGAASKLLSGRGRP